MAVMVINKENFQNEVLNSDKPVLLDFYADWCGPCRMVGPIVEEIAGERSDIKVGKINVDEQSELAAQFGVMSIPMLAVIKNGEVVNRKSRFWQCCKEETYGTFFLSPRPRHQCRGGGISSNRRRCSAGCQNNGRVSSGTYRGQCESSAGSNRSDWKYREK